MIFLTVKMHQRNPNVPYTSKWYEDMEDFRTQEEVHEGDNIAFVRMKGLIRHFATIIEPTSDDFICYDYLGKVKKQFPKLKKILHVGDTKKIFASSVKGESGRKPLSQIIESSKFRIENKSFKAPYFFDRLKEVEQDCQRYKIFKKNCEIIAIYLRSGAPVSIQVARFFFIPVQKVINGIHVATLTYSLVHCIKTTLETIVIHQRDTILSFGLLIIVILIGLEMILGRKDYSILKFFTWTPKARAQVRT